MTARQIPPSMESSVYSDTDSIDMTMTEEPQQTVTNPAEIETDAPTRKVPKQEICILIVGPSGSGKSTFIAAASGLGPQSNIIGHGLDSYTSTCASHKFEHDDAIYTLIDTPGFNDTSRDDLEILGTLAGFLSANDMPPVSAVVFTHNITENRLTGSARLNLDIARVLCGQRFYPRLILLTTMWNKIPADSIRADCEKREGQLMASRTHWGDLSAGGCNVLRFDGTRESAIHVLDQSRGLPGGNARPPELDMMAELRGGMTVEETGAGRVVVEERKRREKQREEELMEIKAEEEERLRLERKKAEKMASREGHGREKSGRRGSRGASGGYHGDGQGYGSDAGGSARYETEDPMDPMAYGYGYHPPQVPPRAQGGDYVVQVDGPGNFSWTARVLDAGIIHRFTRNSGRWAGR
ncbi:hypothetical protein OQA88_2571 [Cercophora sp. LCS_1]